MTAAPPVKESDVRNRVAAFVVSLEDGLDDTEILRRRYDAGLAWTR